MSLHNIVYYCDCSAAPSRTFYYKHGHSLQAWYEQLKDFTHQTEFITLSKGEVCVCVCVCVCVEGGNREEESEREWERGGEKGERETMWSKEDG